MNRITRSSLLLSLLVAVAACSPKAPASGPAPVALVPVSVANNRPEVMTVYIGSHREVIQGLNKAVVMVDRRRFPENGCTTVRLRTLAREEWTSPRFCLAERQVTVVINASLVQSQVWP